MIFVRIAMNALSEKQKEVIQPLVSMIEFTGKQKGCLSHHAFRDIEDGKVFSRTDEWKTPEDQDDHIK